MLSKDRNGGQEGPFLLTRSRSNWLSVSGRKCFVSLAGCAPYYATPAIRLGPEPWIERTLYLQVPKDAPGVSFPGEWDPMGMRATVSRDMLLQDVFVPDDAEVLPPGLFGAMYNAFPHLFLSFSATFLGLMQAAWDGALAYLTGRMPEAPVKAGILRADEDAGIGRQRSAAFDRDVARQRQPNWPAPALGARPVIAVQGGIR